MVAVAADNSGGVFITPFIKILTGAEAGITCFREFKMDVRMILFPGNLPFIMKFVKDH
jgi:hypothetical protein